MTKNNFKKTLHCEEFPGHFQQFSMTVLSKVSFSSKMAAHELFSCVQRTNLLLVFSILSHRRDNLSVLFF